MTCSYILPPVIHNIVFLAFLCISLLYSSNVSAGGWAEVDKAAALANRMNIPSGFCIVNKNDHGDIDDHNRDKSELYDRIKLWKNPLGAIVHVVSFNFILFSERTRYDCFFLT